MTLAEAKTELKHRYPDRQYWSARKDVTDYGDGKEAVRYSISIQPGLDGSLCQGADAATLELAFSIAADTWNPLSRSDDNKE